VLKFTVDPVLTDDVDLTPRFRIAGVTFDFWETLFMDTPELDRRRDELRCQGLRENLAKMGVEISREDLADGLRASTPWLADIWKKGGQVSTLGQIQYIINHATKNRAILVADPEVLMRGLKSPIGVQASPHRLHSTLKLPNYFNDSASAI